MKHYTTTHYDHLIYMKSQFPSWEQRNPAPFHQEPFGGFMWPPRCYTCTFCRREFRSAQALGGHMNVHRRDRAKLKQSSPGQQAEPEIPHHQNRASDPCHEPVSPGQHPRQLSPDNDEDFVETKLTMGIDSVDIEIGVCKRYKKSSSSSPLQFMNGKLCSGERCSEGSLMEDIDLELRLGDPPAVK